MASASQILRRSEPLDGGRSPKLALAWLAWFLALSLLTRISTFGDPNYHNDELLFHLIGLRMHDGLVPYVDIWDRKGFGLFATYYAITAFSRSVLAYQVAAWLFSSITAWIIARLAQSMAGLIGALAAGSLYVLMLPLYQGGGGQAPVFYNLFIALAALIVLSRRDELRRGVLNPRIHAAMACAGLAITFKQTAVIEGMFFGCLVLSWLIRGGMPHARLAGAAASLALCGAAPSLAIAASYAILGHFPEYWHAMVLSNLAKAYNPGGDMLLRIGSLSIIAIPLAIPALFSLLLPAKEERDRAPRGVLAGWLVASLAGLAAVPNFIDHYMLPLMVPLAVAAAPALGRRGPWNVYPLAAAVLILSVGPSLNFAQRKASRQHMEVLVNGILARDPHPRLFVFEGPVYLYAATRSYPPSPLIFPLHLFYQPEDNASHVDTAAEVSRILAWRPTVVVVSHDPPRSVLNPRTAPLVDRYLQGCRLWHTRTIVDYYGPQDVDVWGDCAGR